LQALNHTTYSKYY